LQPGPGRKLIAGFPGLIIEPNAQLV